MASGVGVWLRRAGVLLLVVAAGASVAALNWHRIWSAFVDEAAGAVPVVAWQAQATFQQWVVVSLLSTVGAVVSLYAASVVRTRRSGPDASLHPAASGPSRRS